MMILEEKKHVLEPTPGLALAWHHLLNYLTSPLDVL